MALACQANRTSVGPFSGAAFIKEQIEALQSLYISASAGQMTSEGGGGAALTDASFASKSRVIKRMDNMSRNFEDCCRTLRCGRSVARFLIQDVSEVIFCLNVRVFNN